MRVRFRLAHQKDSDGFDYDSVHECAAIPSTGDFVHLKESNEEGAQQSNRYEVQAVLRLPHSPVGWCVEVYGVRVENEVNWLVAQFELSSHESAS